MKKFSVAFIAIIVAFASLTAYSANKAGEKPVSLDDLESLHKTIITLLMPEIRTSVNGFYEPFLVYEPMVAAYSASKITGIQNEHDAIYTVTLEIEPYIQAHTSVGRDRMTFRISPSGAVALMDYEHLKSYELSKELQSYIKKTLP